MELEEANHDLRLWIPQQQQMTGTMMIAKRREPSIEEKLRSIAASPTIDVSRRSADVEFLLHDAWAKRFKGMLEGKLAQALVVL